LQAKCDNNSKIAGLFTWQSVFNELFNNIEANGFLFNRN